MLRAHSAAVGGCSTHRGACRGSARGELPVGWDTEEQSPRVHEDRIHVSDDVHQQEYTGGDLEGAEEVVSGRRRAPTPRKVSSVCAHEQHGKDQQEFDGSGAVHLFTGMSGSGSAVLSLCRTRARTPAACAYRRRTPECPRRAFRSPWHPRSFSSGTVLHPVPAFPGPNPLCLSGPGHA